MPPSSIKNGVGESFVERLVPGSWAWDLDVCAHAHRYSFASQFTHGKRVLDAGCGVGYGSRMLAVRGALEVVAVDISDEALTVARSQFAHSRVRFVLDDCEVLQNVSGSFDVIVCLENLEHLKNGRNFLKRSSQLLGTEGMLLCSTPNRTSDKGSENPFHVHEYSEDEFRQLLQEYFSDVVIHGQDVTSAVRAIQALWFNPLIRLGRWVQKLRGHRLEQPFTSSLPLSEADFVISEFSTKNARVLIGACGGPLGR